MGAVGDIGVNVSQHIDPHSSLGQVVNSYNLAMGVIGIKNLGQAGYKFAKNLPQATKELLQKNGNLRVQLAKRYQGWKKGIEKLKTLNKEERNLLDKQEEVWRSLGFVDDFKKLIYRNVSYEDFIKTFNATDEQYKIAFKLWGEEKWDELYKFFKENGINEGNGVVWPPYSGFSKVNKTIPANKYTLRIDRFQKETSLGGGFGSPILRNGEGIESLAYTYDSRMLSDKLDDGVYYFLVKNQSIYKSRYKLFMKLLCDESEISLKFINEYIAQREDKKNFLTALLKEWSGFCEYIFEKSNYSMNEKYELFEQILLCVEDIKEFLQIQGEDLIKKMIENDVMYLYKPENNNPFESQAEDLLKNLLEVKIKKIENPKDKYEYLYRIICFKNYYKITEANISLILKEFDGIEVETTFKVANYTTVSKSTHKPLIEYVNSNIQEYITEVYLKLPDVQQEDEYKFKELLKNENLDEEIKVQIIEKVETSISELKDLKSLPIKKSLLENKRVLPTWENIEDYYKSCQNSLKEELINFLNNNDVYSALSDKKINTSYKDLESDILVCNDISDEAYHKIIKSFEGVYESLDFKDLSENKVDYLLEAHKFSMSKNNYDTLRKSFPNKHIVLVESYFDSFLEDIDNFELDEEDVLLILNSEGISIEQKLIYIPTIEEEFILRDDTISKKIAELIISKSHKFDFSYDVIESLCKNTTKEEDKIKLIILYNDDIDNEKIKELIKSIGQEYEKIFLPKKKPCFQHTEENETLLKMLRNRKLINSYKVENNNLRAIALYQ